TRMCGTPCAPSMRISEPFACAAAIIRLIGLIVPRAFEAWPTDTSFTRGFSIRSYSSTSSSPLSLTGMMRSVAFLDVGPSPRLRDEVDRLGRATREDDLLHVAGIQEALHVHARVLVLHR